MNTQKIIEKLDLFALEYQYPIRKMFIFSIDRNEDTIADFDISMRNHAQMLKNIRNKLIDLSEKYYICDFNICPQYRPQLGYYDILSLYVEELNEDMPKSNINKELISKILELIIGGWGQMKRQRHEYLNNDEFADELQKWIDSAENVEDRIITDKLALMI